MKRILKITCYGMIILFLIIVMIYWQIDNGKNVLSKEKIDLENGEVNYTKIFNPDFDDIKKEQGGIAIELSRLEIKTVKTDKDKLNIMKVYMTLYNKSDVTLEVNPNKGYIYNDFCEKISASVINSDDIGGKIKPGEFKYGMVVFPLVQKVFANNNHFKFIVDAPKGPNEEKLGNDFEIDIKLALPIRFDKNGELQ